MDFYYFYLTVTVVLVYWVFQDPNVPRYIELRLQLLRIDIIRYFMLRKMKRQIEKDRKELEKWVNENVKDKM